MTEQIRVLVVDDQPGEAKLIGMLLEKEFAAKTKLVNSFEEALLEMNTGGYDIVTLDYQLYDHDGLELLEKTQDMNPGMPIVMVTGHGDEKTAVNAFKLGVSGYVVKDNRMTTLLVEEIRSALARSALIHAEKELEEKAEERKLLLENIPTMVWYLTDHSTCGAVNKAMADFFGRDQQWFEGKLISDLLCTEEAEECVSSNKTVFESKERTQSEKSLSNKDGKKHVFNVTKIPKLGAEGTVQYIVCTAENITERKRVEKIVKAERDLALQLSENLEFEQLLEKCIEIILDTTGYDVGGAYLLEEETGVFKNIYNTGARSKEAVEAVEHIAPDNPRYPLLAGGEHIYMNFKDFPIPADDARMKEGLKVSSIFPIKDRDRVIGSINVASHIVEEISQETKDLIESLSGQVGQILSRAIVDRALRKSEIRHRILFDSNRAGILYLDKNGDVVDVNEAFQLISGFSVGEVKSGAFPKSICTDDSQWMLDEFIRGVFKDGGPDDIECELKRKNGEILNMNIKAWSVNEEKGSPEGVWFVFHDVTKQRRTEKYIRAQRDFAVNVLDTRELKETLKFGLLAILDATGLDAGMTGFLTEDGETFELAYSHNVSNEFSEMAVKVVAADPRYREIQQSGPIYTQYDQLPITKDPVRSGEGIKAIAIVPIWENGELIGGVNVGSHTTEEIPQESREIIESLANQIGQAISRHRLLSSL